MLSRRNLLLAVAALTAAGIAGAVQAPALVVLVQYVVSERSAGRVEEILTSPIERTLRTLPRIVKMRSATGNKANGVNVDLELHFEGGATVQDLAAVLSQLAHQKIENIKATSVCAQLRPPRIDDNADQMLR